MELKEFIETTVSAIVDASSGLQQKYQSDDVIVNPPSAQSGSDVYQAGSRNYTMRRVPNIEFDVALTVGSEQGGGGKAGIRVFAAELSGEAKQNSSSEQVSRVPFQVPITLKPSTHEKANTKLRAARD